MVTEPQYLLRATCRHTAIPWLLVNDWNSLVWLTLSKETVNIRNGLTQVQSVKVCSSYWPAGQGVCEAGLQT